MRLPTGATRLAQRALRQTSTSFGPPKGVTNIAEQLAGASKHTIHQAVPESRLVRKLPLDPMGYNVGLFKERQNYVVYPQYVADLPKGRCIGESGWIVTDDDLLLIDISPELGADKNTHSALFTFRFPPIRFLAGTSLALTSPGRRNYAHWMLEALPRLELARRVGVDLTGVDHLLIACNQGFRLETLQAAGVGAEKVVFMDNARHVRCDRLLAPTIPAINGNPHPWAVEFIRSLFPNLEPFPHKRIYVSRGRRQGARSVTNEDELMTLLEDHGFTSVQLEEFSVQDQARIFASAEAIVAPHGAGLTNLAFASKGAKVVEIFGPRYINPIFWILADIVDAEYAYVMAQGEIEEKPRVSGIGDPMTVDIAAVKKALEALGL